MKHAWKNWLALGAMLIGLNLSAVPPVKKPNVLFIAVDDLNAWVTHLGRNRQAKTPNIDRLAARGVSFARAYTAAPACEPSRAALMSGMRPWTSACYVNGDKWKKQIPERIGLAAQFLKAGYHVAGAGNLSRWHVFSVRVDGVHGRDRVGRTRKTRGQG